MWNLIAGLFLVAIVYVLVRPQSKGADLIQAAGDALTAIVSNAADLASPEASGE